MHPSIRVIEQKDFASHPLLARLLELHTPPKQLYIQGELPEITLDEYGRATPRILTVVGSRKNTLYGKQALEMLINSLQGENVIVLSGLAYGIDALAHTLALKNNIVTIAIPGSGLSEKVLYPSAHRALAKDILGYDGLLISELPPETSASPWTFPSRNRIMAALSDALLVVEAEEKSGTLVTARQALELGRDIGAIPGDIFSPTSSGTNMLIHEGAYCISAKEHLYSFLHISMEVQENPSPVFTHNEKILIDLLREKMDRDELFTASKLSHEDFITSFSLLEINGYISETFGEVRRLV